MPGYRPSSRKPYILGKIAAENFLEGARNSRAMASIRQERRHGGREQTDETIDEFEVWDLVGDQRPGEHRPADGPAARPRAGFVPHPGPA
jgi:hypothetical protein